MTRQPPRMRAPLFAPAELPEQVMEELRMVAETLSDRSAGEGTTRTIVVFEGRHALVLEQMTPATVRDLFPELKKLYQPETVLHYLNRLAKERRRAFQRLNRPNWATNW